jgi:O-antigen ligase
MIISRSEIIKDFIKNGGLTFVFCLLSVIILPIYIHYLPPVMILWVLFWIYENKSGLKKDIIIGNKAAILFFLFVVFYLWQTAGLLFADSLSVGFERLFKRLSLLVFPLVLFYPGSRIINNINLIIRMFAVCAFVYIIYCLGNALHCSLSIQNHNWIFNPHPTDYEYENFFYGYRLSYPVHPSYFSMYIVLSMLISLEALFDSSMDYLKKGLFLTMIIVFLVIIYLLSSRAGMFSAVVVLPLYFLYKLFRIFPKWILLLSFFVMILIFLKIAWTNDRLSYNYDGVTKTQPNEIIKNDVRYDIWRSSIGVIKQNFIFGVGTGDASKDLAEEFLNRGYVNGFYDNLNAHNQFLETLLENGLIGLIIFFAIIGYMLYIAISQRNLLLGLFIISTTIFFVFETMLNRLAGVSFFALFSFLLIYTKMNKQKINNNDIKSEA